MTATPSASPTSATSPPGSEARPSGGAPPSGGPSVPTRVIVKHVLLAIGALALVLLGLAAFEPSGIPDRTEVIGPFELVTHSSGRRGRPSLQWFSLRHRGQPVVFQGRAGMFGDRVAEYDRFNSAITFQAPEPVVVVNAGDPINGGFFYLVREKNGTPEALPVGPSHGGVSAEFLDAPVKPRIVPTPRDITTRRARLEGGRWLLLGDYCVLDTQTLEAHAFDEAKDASLNQSAPPLALSPDRRSLVRIGTEAYPRDGLLLLVFDFVANSSQALAVDTTSMRVGRWEDIDRAWLDHYFEWQRADGRPDRLVPRLGVKPLPYKGRLTVSPSDGYREYRLSPVSPRLRDVLVAFVQREFGGTVPSTTGGPDGPVDVAVGDFVVTVSQHGDEVVVYMDRAKGGTRLVADIAQRFDRELAAGGHDPLFVVPGSTERDDDAAAPQAPEAGR